MVLPLCQGLLVCEWIYRIGTESTSLQRVATAERIQLCLAGSLPGLPGTLGCLPALSASLWNELISFSVDFAHDDDAGPGVTQLICFLTCLKWCRRWEEW